MPAPLVEALYRRHTRRALALDGAPAALVELLADRGLDAATLRGRLDGILAWDLPPWPRIPMLWLAGATDPQIDWTPAEALAALPEGTVYAHVPGGHRPYASHPGPLADRLEGWWRGLD